MAGDPLTAPDDEVHEFFAYGSNLDPERMAARCPGAHARRPARLPGHALHFNKLSLERDGTGYANVEPADGVVEGALYSLTKTDLLRLDRVVGYPAHYTRRLLVVEEADGTRVAAWVYSATPEWRGPIDMPPHGAYLAHLLAGADVLGPEHRARLERLAAPADS